MTIAEEVSHSANTALIGAVHLVAPTHAISASTVPMPIKTPAHNSSYQKGRVSCSKDIFVVNETLVFQIKFCGKSPALRITAKRYQ